MQRTINISSGRVRLPWFLVFLLIAVFGLGAQEERAVIYYAQGNDFALTVNGVRSIIDISNLDSSGLIVGSTDMIQTGAGVSLELQLIPSGTVIKVVENTSLVYNGFDRNGGFTDLGLLYGRIRLVSGTGWSERTAVVRAGNISVRLLNGDFGVDFAVDPAYLGGLVATAPLLTVYNFRGNAEIHPFMPGNDTQKPIPIAKAESITVEVNPPLVYTGRVPLERDIVDFWRRHNFVGHAPLSMPYTSLFDLFPEVQVALVEPVPAPAPEPRKEGLDLAGWQAEMGWYQKAYRHKTAFLIAGIALTVIGTGAQIYACTQFYSERDSLAKTLYYSSYAPLGLGLLSILGGTLYNPLVPLD
jgi:hypothetical protein